MSPRAPIDCMIRITSKYYCLHDGSHKPEHPDEGMGVDVLYHVISYVRHKTSFLSEEDEVQLKTYFEVVNKIRSSREFRE